MRKHLVVFAALLLVTTVGCGGGGGGNSTDSCAGVFPLQLEAIEISAGIVRAEIFSADGRDWDTLVSQGHFAGNSISQIKVMWTVTDADGVRGDTVVGTSAGILLAEVRGDWCVGVSLIWAGGTCGGDMKLSLTTCGDTPPIVDPPDIPSDPNCRTPQEKGLTQWWVRPDEGLGKGWFELQDGSGQSLGEIVGPSTWWASRLEVVVRDANNIPVDFLVLDFFGGAEESFFVELPSGAYCVEILRLDLRCGPSDLLVSSDPTVDGDFPAISVSQYCGNN